MSDTHHHEEPIDPGAQVFRAALPGWQSVIADHDRDVPVMFVPGRGSLEGSILLSAFALLEPVLAIAALVFALRARSAGNRRWLAALLASLWCGGLGLVLRMGLGFGLVP
jgi:hypothetical protein